MAKTPISYEEFYRLAEPGIFDSHIFDSGAVRGDYSVYTVDKHSANIPLKIADLIVLQTMLPGVLLSDQLRLAKLKSSLVNLLEAGDVAEAQVMVDGFEARVGASITGNLPEPTSQTSEGISIAAIRQSIVDETLQKTLGEKYNGTLNEAIIIALLKRVPGLDMTKREHVFSQTLATRINVDVSGEMVGKTIAKKVLAVTEDAVCRATGISLPAIS